MLFRVIQFPANLYGVVYFIHSFVLCRRKGVIINIASGIASFPCPVYTLYAASKVKLFIKITCLLIGSFTILAIDLGLCRSLWKDFLKVFKQSTRTEGSSYRYSLSPRLRITINQKVFALIPKNPFFRQLLHLGSLLGWHISRKPILLLCCQKTLYKNPCSTSQPEKKPMAASVTQSW